MVRYPFLACILVAMSVSSARALEQDDAALAAVRGTHPDPRRSPLAPLVRPVPEGEGTLLVPMAGSGSTAAGRAPASPPAGLATGALADAAPPMSDPLPPEVLAAPPMSGPLPPQAAVAPPMSGPLPPVAGSGAPQRGGGHAPGG